MTSAPGPVQAPEDANDVLLAVAPPPARASPSLQRSARALIGWMTHEEALAMQAGRQVGVSDEEHMDRANAARAAVERRPIPAEVPPSDLDLPAELESHIHAMRSNQATAGMLADGWVPRVVDLRMVRALQPVVFEDDAEDRVSTLDPGDIAALARVTMPVVGNERIPVAFNSERQAFVFSSPNPNLRIQGHFQAEVAPGVPGFGFVVGLSQSIMQVACQTVAASSAMAITGHMGSLGVGSPRFLCW
jgi:hypothetical protein